MDSRGLLSFLFAFDFHSFCASKPFREERTSRLGHRPSSLSVFLGFSNLTAAGGLISSLFFPPASLSSSAIHPAALGAHRFPFGRLGSVGPGIKIRFRRRRIVQRLVRPLLIVPVKPPAQPASG